MSHPPFDLRKRMNEDRLRIFPDDRPIAFVCECDDATCLRTVVLTSAQYRARAGEQLLHESHHLREL